ncbi:hypothetical protein BTC77_24855, partial [Salmonella enterica subsp. enterica serovar Senftenberg]|nr:hypothetical protein [Salmonella enterica subsp. enterica serovar Senftenberg]
LNHYIDEKTLKLWLEHNIEEGERPLYTKDGAEDNVRYIRNAGVLLNLLKTNADVREKYCNSLLSTDSQPIAKAKIELLMKKFATTLFAEVNTIDNVNKKFAKLCYHRSSIFSPRHLPFLSLGTVVKSTLTGGDYYICIQQRCDSVRIGEDESRRFLFISLKQVDDGGFNFLTPDGIKLKIDRSTYSLRTIKFNGSDGVALAKKDEDNKKYFEPTYYSENHH